MILTHDELRLARINHSHTGRAASAEILALLDHIDAQTERIAALEAWCNDAQEPLLAAAGLFERFRPTETGAAIEGMFGHPIASLTADIFALLSRLHELGIDRAALAGGEEG